MSGCAWLGIGGSDKKPVPLTPLTKNDASVSWSASVAKAGGSLFVPAVGNFRQGMLVQLPLHLDLLPGQPKASDLHDALAAHYRGSTWVSVEPPTDSGKLDALALNDTNKMELRVFANESYRQAVLIARLDNLGKGASGAAVQNLQLMLGI